jgi:hypothetical protein
MPYLLNAAAGATSVTGEAGSRSPDMIVKTAQRAGARR